MPRTKYEADDGSIHVITLGASRLAVAGDPPAGDVTDNIRAKVSKSNREYGIRPRGVRLARSVSGGTDIFTKYSFLPVLTPVALASATFALTATLVIDGVTWEIIAKVGEDF